MGITPIPYWGTEPGGKIYNNFLALNKQWDNVTEIKGLCKLMQIQADKQIQLHYKYSVTEVELISLLCKETYLYTN